MKSLRELLRLTRDPPHDEQLPASLDNLWHQWLGPLLGPRASLIKWSPPVLKIAVHTPADQELFNSGKAWLISRWNALVPENPIQHLEVVLVPRTKSETSNPAIPSPGTPLPDEEERRLQQMMRPIENPILRRRLIRAYRRNWWRSKAGTPDKSKTGDQQ